MSEPAEPIRTVASPIPTSGARWRKVHLDFHNSQHVDSIGDRFDPESFISTLREARVDSIVLFAKDMHGFAYYPSRHAPVHPGLRFDLLGRQVEACRAAGIETSAYICTLWDHRLAFERPEWLSVRRDGSTYLPGPDETPGWTALCASNQDLVDWQAALVQEVLDRYPVDGIWLDMPIPRDGECFCEKCRNAMADPYDVAEQRRFQQSLHIGFLNAIRDAAKAVRPNVQVDFNNQPAFGLPGRIAAMDNVDIEALPTSQWGYEYYPALARYLRTMPRTFYGMTGRFHKGWGDFGGVKSPAQLEAECFQIVALGGRCDVGDQMPPNGILDPASYRAIGAAYREIERIERVLEGASPVAEAVVVAEGLPLDLVATPSISGVVKVLAELNLQFDVMESGQDPSGYSLAIHLDQDQGFRRGTLSLGSHLPGAEPCPFDPAYLVLPDLGEFALYGPSCSWTPEGVPLARLGVPAFNRTAEHFTSHVQAPLDRITDGAVAEVRGAAARIGFDLGRCYAETGYHVYRELLLQILDAVLPRRLARSESPLIQLHVMRGPGRWLVHVLDASMARPMPGHPPYYEAGPPRADVRFRLNLGKVRSARAVRSGAHLVADGEDWILPRLDRYELIVLETDDAR